MDVRIDIYEIYENDKTYDIKSNGKIKGRYFDPAIQDRKSIKVLNISNLDNLQEALLTLLKGVEV